MTAAEAPQSAAIIDLAVEQGVALSTALAQHVARRLGIRMLVIKGPLVAELGLRTRLHSTDVDIITEPTRAADLIDALGEYGWMPRPWPDFPKLLEQHSRTLIHESWPNDIDVHHYWPGFLATPEESFEQLWRHRIQLDVAGHDIDIPDLAGSALVLALHSLREEGQVDDDSRQMSEYAELVRALKGMQSAEHVHPDRSTDDLAQQVLADARRTGSEQTARRFLVDLGEYVPLIADRDADESLRMWRLNSRSEHAMTGWLLTLQRAPLHAKPGIAYKAFFPSRSDLEAIDPEFRSGDISLRQAWWRRVSRGLHGIAQARRDLRGMND